MRNQTYLECSDEEDSLCFAGTDAHRQPVMTIDQETVDQLMVELNQPSDEELFLATALTMLRNGTIPMVRLTAEQLDELEDERIGASLCETPQLW